MIFYAILKITAKMVIPVQQPVERVPMHVMMLTVAMETPQQDQQKLIPTGSIKFYGISLHIISIV